jgi:putative heme degradation protein
MQQPEAGIALRSRYAALIEASPELCAFDAATALGVSEVELVDAGCVGRAIRLQPDWRGLFQRFRGLGRVMALTRSQHAVHEKVGCYEDVPPGGQGPGAAGAARRAASDAASRCGIRPIDHGVVRTRRRSRSTPAQS